ncbi:hypothetical protein SPI_00897 [Niveomyces insectorum RCEF 264]|uniref:Uncharacterized protein n=1 Tax=Niveomyces insectorum RCEF 264 TaxID=1081102 RepID=A0A162JGP1_9HYPO|nr:hypothetical protein SPI_00897 [Niveomyces insectorum RCEF 264]
MSEPIPPWQYQLLADPETIKCSQELQPPQPRALELRGPAQSQENSTPDIANSSPDATAWPTSFRTLQPRSGATQAATVFRTPQCVTPWQDERDEDDGHYQLLAVREPQTPSYWPDATSSSQVYTLLAPSHAGAGAGGSTNANASTGANPAHTLITQQAAYGPMPATWPGRLFDFDTVQPTDNSDQDGEGNTPPFPRLHRATTASDAGFRLSTTPLGDQLLRQDAQVPVTRFVLPGEHTAQRMNNLTKLVQRSARNIVEEAALHQPIDNSNNSGNGTGDSETNGTLGYACKSPLNSLIQTDSVGTHSVNAANLAGRTSSTRCGHNGISLPIIGPPAAKTSSSLCVNENQKLPPPQVQSQRRPFPSSSDYTRTLGNWREQRPQPHAVGGGARISGSPDTPTLASAASTGTNLSEAHSPEAGTLLAPAAPGSLATAVAATPGFIPPMTGYEFELNHDGNLRELLRQKVWARAQLSSCNENNRYHHTQTTACVAAVNGHIIGPYNPDSLWCYGTNPDIVGLRVTMTVFEGPGAGSGAHGVAGSDETGRATDEAGAGDDDTGADTTLPTLCGATLVLRHQIIMPHMRHHARAVPSPSLLAPLSSSSLHPYHNGGSSSSSTTATATTNNHRSMSSPVVPPTTQASPVQPTHGSHSANAASNSFQQQQGRRFLFATTTIPLQGGMPARPGYHPVDAAAAVDRLRQWGGQPDKGVFGNAWLIHLVVAPGHVQHVVDTKVVEQVTRMAANYGAGSGGGGGSSSNNNASNSMNNNGPSHGHAPLGKPLSPVAAAQRTMQMVNLRMDSLARQEGTLSIMLSNHATQKRIARQCPDLVAMWVLAQDNL